jgi:hypothetical protein
MQRVELLIKGFAKPCLVAQPAVTQAMAKSVRAVGYATVDPDVGILRLKSIFLEALNMAAKWKWILWISGALLLAIVRMRASQRSAILRHFSLPSGQTS